MKQISEHNRSAQICATCALALLLFASCSVQPGSGGSGSDFAAASAGYRYSAETTDADGAWEDYDYAEDAAREEIYEAIGEAGEELYKSLDEMASTGAAEPGRKIITTVDLRMESKEYDRSAQNIYDAIDEHKGYIEQSDITGSIGRGNDASSAPLEGMLSGLASPGDAVALTSASEDYAEYHTSIDKRRMFLTIRVPQETLSAFLEVVEAQGNVLNKQESAEDVTLDYVDVESHKKALQAEQARLLEMLERAENVEDMILLEERLSRVRYQLESYESRLRVYDNLISYSTVNLTLDEVIVYTEKPKEVIPDPTLGQRISMGMRGTLNDISTYWTNLFVSFMTNLIYIAAAVAAIVTAVLIVRRQLRKHPGNWRDVLRPETPSGAGDAADPTGTADLSAESVAPAAVSPSPHELADGDRPDGDAKKKR